MASRDSSARPLRSASSQSTASTQVNTRWVVLAVLATLLLSGVLFLLADLLVSAVV
jgi:hypothetical protein